MLIDLMSSTSKIYTTKGKALQENLFNRISSVICSEKERQLHLHEPRFDAVDKDFLNKCIDSGFVSSVGEYVNQFEGAIKSFTQTKGAVACVNGTAALHLCLIASKASKGDEVLLPSLTFIATANACIYHNTVPHFVDVSTESLSVDPQKLRLHLEENTVMKNGDCFNKNTNRRISALIVMHCFGHIGDFEALCKISEDYNIDLIEDAAESLGSSYQGRPSGSLSKFAALSFNGNKIITTGGGGMFLTNDISIAKKIRHLSTTAKNPHPYKFIHDEIGFNYRMPNLNAALGMAQFAKLPTYLRQKRKLAESYQEAFKNCEYADFVTEPENCKSNYWLNFIKFNTAVDLDSIIPKLHERNVFARPIWTPLHKSTPYTHCPSATLDNTNTLENRILCLPSSPFLAGAPND